MTPQYDTTVDRQTSQLLPKKNKFAISQKCPRPTPEILHQFVRRCLNLVLWQMEVFGERELLTKFGHLLSMRTSKTFLLSSLVLYKQMSVYKRADWIFIWNIIFFPPSDFIHILHGFLFLSLCKYSKNKCCRRNWWTEKKRIQVFAFCTKPSTFFFF